MIPELPKSALVSGSGHQLASCLPREKMMVAGARSMCSIKGDTLAGDDHYKAQKGIATGKHGDGPAGGMTTMRCNDTGEIVAILNATKGTNYKFMIQVIKDVDEINRANGIKRGIVLYLDNAQMIGDLLIDMAGGVLGPPRPLRMPRLELPKTRVVVMVSDKAQAISVCNTLMMCSGAFGVDMEWPAAQGASTGRVRSF